MESSLPPESSSATIPERQRLMQTLSGHVDPWQRRQAAIGLEKYTDNEVTEALILATKDVSSRVRYAATLILSERGGENVREALVAASNDTDTWVRRNADKGLNNPFNKDK